ncbi:MAG TPA: hypothetical protein DEA55_04085 [Rhodospirillaceae bacterium]|nr:hypothetical protein [Rhodospirillaceae bacterium]
MTEKEKSYAERPPVGNLTDFVYGVDSEGGLHIEVAVKEDGKVVLFHDKVFKNELSWLEFDLETNELNFVLDDGDIRDIGLPLSKSVAKHMQNSHQVLMVLIDDKTGDAKEGNYVPLIIHRR